MADEDDNLEEGAFFHALCLVPGTVLSEQDVDAIQDVLRENDRLSHVTAAAPDLLDALKTYIEAELNTGNPSLSIAAYNKACEKALQKAIAAVAKAEGRSNG